MRNIFLLTFFFLLTNIRDKECFAKAGGFASLMPMFLLEMTRIYSLQVCFTFRHLIVQNIGTFLSLSPVKTRGYRVELVRLSVRPSVRPSVRLSVPLEIGYFVHASWV